MEWITLENIYYHTSANKTCRRALILSRVISKQCNRRCKVDIVIGNAQIEKKVTRWVGRFSYFGQIGINDVVIDRRNGERSVRAKCCYWYRISILHFKL